MSGSDSDAVSAYPQALLKGPLTWIALPRHRHPKGWEHIPDPVCILRLNLYGHPLAGLYWEQHCRKVITKNGFVPVRGWECLYKHVEQGLFLSVYVDDFKMAGKAGNLDKMWKQLGKDLDLEPPVPLNENVYLGCAQKDVKPDHDIVQNKHTLYQELLSLIHI